MFYSYNWFENNRLAYAARQRLMNWLQSADLAVYALNRAEPDQKSYGPRALTEAELKLIETRLKYYDEYPVFAGFVAGRHLSEVQGFALFEFSDDWDAASLQFLVTQEPDNLSPLQSPVLNLALYRLLKEHGSVKQVRLPSAENEDIQAAAEILATLNLKPGTDGDDWRQINNNDLIQTYYNTIYTAIDSDQHWLELSLHIEPDLDDYIVDLLTHFSYKQRRILERPLRATPLNDAIVDEQAPFTVKGYLPDNPEGRRRAEVLRRMLAGLGRLRPLNELEQRVISNQEYLVPWEEYNHYRVGRNIVVMMPDESYTPGPQEIAVVIPPAIEVFSLTRFGLHPTTRLCLTLLEDHFDPAAHSNVLDLGTGSGVLSIVAARLGAKSILALDANLKAVAMAQDNIALNDVAERVTVAAGSLAVTQPVEDSSAYSFDPAETEPPPELAARLPFDLIMANTIAHVVISLAPHFYEALRPGGLLISSGILQPRQADVEAALASSGLELVEKREELNWTGYLHRKV